MYCADALTLDAPKRTREGYLGGRARAARTGVYDYAGFEVDPDNKHGLRDKATVKVLRDANTVFDRAAVQSFIGKPVTNNHPASPVNKHNWRDHARGVIMGAVREGEYLAFDYLLMDAEAISAVDGGKRQLSNGYEAELEFGQFTAPDGTICDARQSRILGGNHVALVDRGRAGSDCAIKDGAFAVCDAITAEQLDRLKASLTNEKELAMAGTITIDGLLVPLADEAAVRAVIDKQNAALADSAKALADAQTALSTEQGKVAVLEKDLADAKAENDPAKIDARVADRAALVAKAKAIKADIITDGKSDADIRKEVVTAKLGDAAAVLDDAAINGAFVAISADAANTVKNLAPAQNVNDAIAGINAARAARNVRLANAHKGA